MHLRPDWRTLIKRAWSIRFIALAFVFTWLEIALPLLDGLLPIGPRVFTVLAGFSTGAAFVARLVAQRGITSTRAGGSDAGQ